MPYQHYLWPIAAPCCFSVFVSCSDPPGEILRRRSTAIFGGSGNSVTTRPARSPPEHLSDHVESRDQAQARQTIFPSVACSRCRHLHLQPSISSTAHFQEYIHKRGHYSRVLTDATGSCVATFAFSTPDRVFVTHMW